MHKESGQSLFWIFRQLKPYKSQLSTAAILTLLTCAMGFVPVWALYEVSIIFFDDLNTRPLWDQPGLYWIGIATLAVSLCRYPLITFAYILTHKAAYDALYQMRRTLLAKLTRIQMGFFTTKSQGELKKILSEDVERIELFIAHHLPDLLTAIATPVFGFALLCWVDWKLALLSLAPIPFAVFIQRHLFSDFEQDFQEWHLGLERLNSSMLQFIQGMQVIRAFNLSATKGTHLQQHIDAHHETIRRWTQKAASGYTGLRLSMEASILILLPVGCWLVLKGSIDIPILILFLLVGGALLEPLNNLLMFGGMLSRIFQGVERIKNIHSQPELTIQTDQTQKDVPQRAEIALENVSFNYTDQDLPALKNISCEFRKNTLTAIVGPSGSGKSTLVKLLLRFYDPDTGCIHLKNRNLKTYESAELSQLIAMVFQEQFVLNDSIAENISMGQLYPFNEIARAASLAQASGFIQELPDGYNTRTGESGELLSGGEQQRLNIARAILKDAPIVILDEATAFSDANNEAEIQKSLNQLLKDKTVIIIAHRLESIRHADHIIVLDQGKVAAQGKHEQLLKKSDIYQGLWKIQSSSQNWTIESSSYKKKNNQ